MKFTTPSFWLTKKYNKFLIFLIPLSILFRFTFYVKKFITQEKKVPAKVICVGNIFLGGTGKTPLSIELLKIVKQLGKNPVIIKKFYKDHEDEISLIAHKTGSIIVGKNRIIASEEAVGKKFDTLILDDGLQDNSIYQDLRIVCFSATTLIGNGLIFPAGPLRQQLSSISNSHIVVINQLDSNFDQKFISEIKKANDKIKIYYSTYKADPEDINRLKNEEIIAFAGIGNANNFFQLLKNNGLNLKKEITFPDHYDYKKQDIDKIVEQAKEANCELLTTEKDFFRLNNSQRKNIKVLKIKLEIKDKKNLKKILISKL